MSYEKLNEFATMEDDFKIDTFSCIYYSNIIKDYGSTFKIGSTSKGESILISQKDNQKWLQKIPSYDRNGRPRKDVFCKIIKTQAPKKGTTQTTTDIRKLKITPWNIRNRYNPVNIRNRYNPGVNDFWSDFAQSMGITGATEQVKATTGTLDKAAGSIDNINETVKSMKKEYDYLKPLVITFFGIQVVVWVTEIIRNSQQIAGKK